MKTAIHWIMMLTLLSTATAQEHNLYWAPPNVTVGGRAIDGLLDFIFWLTAATFIITQGIFVYYLIRYRRQPGKKAHYSHGHNFLEIVWTTVPVIVFVSLALYSNTVWSKLHRDPPADALPVNVMSFQYGWEFRYPGPDGKLGVTDVAKISLENRFGVDEADEAGKDDFVTNELVIPAGRAIHIYLNSRDVIHSFYVPSFRLYQDAVPGRTISWVWFEVEKPGKFELACSQLCGVGHYNMKAPIRVVTAEEYEKWAQEKQQQPPPPAPSPAPNQPDAAPTPTPDQPAAN